MATGVVPIEGNRVLLQAAVGLLDMSSLLSLAVYTNNMSPSKSSVYGDFDQPTDPLYTPIGLNPGDWVLNTDPSGETAAHPLVSFQFLGPVTLYGALLFAGFIGGSVCILAFKFDAPIVLPDVGGSAGVTVTQFNSH